MDSQLAQSCRSGHVGHGGQVGEAFSPLPELDVNALIKVLREPRGVCWLPRFQQEARAPIQSRGGGDESD